jgi:hypothetical protein
VFKDLHELVNFYITSHDGRLQPLLKEQSDRVLNPPQTPLNNIDESEEGALQDYIELVDGKSFCLYSNASHIYGISLRNSALVISILSRIMVRFSNKFLFITNLVFFQR